MGAADQGRRLSTTGFHASNVSRTPIPAETRLSVAKALIE
jgi:hypothetical protein